MAQPRLDILCKPCPIPPAIGPGLAISPCISKRSHNHARRNLELLTHLSSEIRTLRQSISQAESRLKGADAVIPVAIPPIPAAISEPTTEQTISELKRELSYLKSELRAAFDKIRRQRDAIVEVLDYFKDGLESGNWASYDATKRMLSRWRGATQSVGSPDADISPPCPTCARPISAHRCDSSTLTCPWCGSGLILRCPKCR